MNNAPSLKTWRFRMQQMCGFVAEHKHLPLQGEYYNNFDIGSWLKVQRWKYKNNTLNVEQITKLQKYKALEPKKIQWREKMQILREFVAEYNRLPKQTEHYKNVALGAWLKSQRCKYKYKKLNIEQITKLQKYNALVSIKDKWQAHMQELQEFINKHDRLPKIYETINGFAIGKWLSKQREKHKRGKLDAKQILVLKKYDALNPFIRPWRKCLQCLQEFITEYNCLPRASDAINGFAIGKWLTHQRYLYKQNKLSHERIESLYKLNALPI